MTGPYKIALCGFGKIARDHHQPTIFAHKDLALAALVDPQISPGDNPTGAPLYPDMNTLLREGPPGDAVAFCEPPPFRFANAALAVQAGKHVFLEKPPCATLEEAHALADLAAKAGVTLFAAWHSRYAGGVAEARAWLKTRTVRAARIDWLEDVRVWHPGQDWLWRPGALGVFDPGINALSTSSPNPSRLSPPSLPFRRTGLRRSPPVLPCAPCPARRSRCILTGVRRARRPGT